MFLLWRGKLFTSKAMLWALMLAFPFTYIANIAGWTTAETARQPWVVYGLLRTEDGASPASRCRSGAGLFTLLGFAGLYVLVGILFLVLIARIVNQGPEDRRAADHVDAAAAGAGRADGDRLVLLPRGDGRDVRGARRLRSRRRRAAPLLARTEEEREQATAAIGPVWNGNEVWLIAGGGVLFMAFPKAYAGAFSGLYFGLILVLWLLVGRGLGLELRHQIDNPLWRGACDAVFCLSSAALALVFGVALGNVVRGVPLGADGYFSLPLFNILNWYALLVGVFGLVVLAAQGANFLAFRGSGALAERARRWARGC